MNDPSYVDSGKRVGKRCRIDGCNHLIWIWELRNHCRDHDGLGSDFCDVDEVHYREVVKAVSGAKSIYS